MNLTPVNVTLGQKRGIVEFATENGSKIKVACDAIEARTFVDKIDTPLAVTFTDAPKKEVVSGK